VAFHNVLIRLGFCLDADVHRVTFPVPYEACPPYRLENPAAKIQRAPAEAYAQPLMLGVKPCQAAVSPLMRQGADPISSNLYHPSTLRDRSAGLQPFGSKELEGM
jgi:hypothetical protein